MKRAALSVRNWMDVPRKFLENLGAISQGRKHQAVVGVAILYARILNRP